MRQVPKKLHQTSSNCIVRFTQLLLCHEYMSHIKHFYMVLSVLLCILPLQHVIEAFFIPLGGLRTVPIYWCQKVSVCFSHKFIIVLFCAHSLVQHKCSWTVKHANIFWHKYCRSYRLYLNLYIKLQNKDHTVNRKWQEGRRLLPWMKKITNEVSLWGQ